MAIAISKTPVLKSKEAAKFQKLAHQNRDKLASKKEVNLAAKTFIAVAKKKSTSFFF